MLYQLDPRSHLHAVYLPRTSNMCSIRYATPPTGGLRWQMPLIPKTDRTVVDATSYGNICPQIPRPSQVGNWKPGPEESEDCLTINVWSPSGINGKKPLPVMVWIHGGGYKMGDGRSDLSEFINRTDNSIVGVTIQYRVSSRIPRR